MTKDDIIGIAQEAGLPVAWISDNGVLQWNELTRFAALVAAAEREACIDIVAFHGGSVEIEADIRARSQSPLVTPRGSLGEEV